MSEARGRILAAIRRGLGRGVLSSPMRDTLDMRLRGEPGLAPLKPELPEEAPDTVFRMRLEAAAGSLERVSGDAAVPAAVAAYRDSRGIAGELGVAPSLADLDWASAGLAPHIGPSRGREVLCVSRAFCAVAETGSLVMLSGAQNPTTLNFLPDHHLVVVHARELVDPLEDVWVRLRRWQDPWPCTINLITGPSRTADVEQTIQLGAHGPRSLHVLWVEMAQDGDRWRS